MWEGKDYELSTSAITRTQLDMHTKSLASYKKYLCLYGQCMSALSHEITILTRPITNTRGESEHLVEALATESTGVFVRSIGVVGARAAASSSMVKRRAAACGGIRKDGEWQLRISDV